MIFLIPLLLIFSIVWVVDFVYFSEHETSVKTHYEIEQKSQMKADEYLRVHVKK